MDYLFEVVHFKTLLPNYIIYVCLVNFIKKIALINMSGVYILRVFSLYMPCEIKARHPVIILQLTEPTVLPELDRTVWPEILYDEVS